MWSHILLLCGNERKRNTLFACICIEPLNGYKRPTTLGIRVAGWEAGGQKSLGGVGKFFTIKNFILFKFSNMGIYSLVKNSNYEILK